MEINFPVRRLRREVRRGNANAQVRLLRQLAGEGRIASSESPLGEDGGGQCRPGRHETDALGAESGAEGGKERHCYGRVSA